MHLPASQGGFYWRQFGRCFCFHAEPDSRGNVGRRSKNRPLRASRNRALLGIRGSTGHQKAMGPGVRDGGRRRSRHEGAGAMCAHILHPCVGSHVSIGSDQQGHPGQIADADKRQASRVAASTDLPSAIQCPLPREFSGSDIAIAAPATPTHRGSLTRSSRSRPSRCPRPKGSP
jgi:hypothetical protein